MLRHSFPWLACLLAATPAVAAEPTDFFETKVRPILAENCYSCHGPERQRGGLRVDSGDALLTGGDTGPALIPKKPEDSRLIKAVKYDGELKMPPKEKLSPEQIEILTTWIKMGAQWPATVATRPVAKSTFTVTPKDREHWAFRPVQNPPVPVVKAKTASPIDAFIAAKLEAKGLTLAPTADKRTLIRRAYFDLIGVPPTPKEVDAFLKDKSPQAFEKVVDHLLASPHFGERWARHWLDVARYGEDQAHTFEARKYPDGYRYRDWVIESFNSDKPYDRFVTEQIAGDLLEGDDQQARLAATGFFALGPIYYGGARHDEIDDRIDTLTRGFLGLTVSCARCHDHKFDPVGITDYYALAGIFASTGYKEYVIGTDGEIDAKTEQLSTDKMKGKDAKTPRKPVIHALQEGPKPANSKVFLRGNPTNPGEEVPRRFLLVLSKENPTPFTTGSGRLELARAITDANNPLTARVMANRIWAHLFGKGIVATPSNFGTLGTPPTHPELLDHLASKFVADGWSMKSLIRHMMLSNAYQMTSRNNPKGIAADADNALFWRQNRKRLEVEPWRDAMLAVSGELDSSLGGESFDLSDAKVTRRTLYAAVSRHNLDPLLRLYDFPDPNVPGDRRAETTVPLQQLFTFNSPFVTARAKALAARLGKNANESETARIQKAFRIVYGRPATKQDVEAAQKYLESAASSKDGAKKDPLTPWEKFAQVLLAANEFLYVD